MGFLSLKKEYNIEHIVAVYDEKKYGGKVICVGSPYIHDIIVIDMHGNIIRRYDDGRSNEKLRRYMLEFDAEPDKLREIVTKADDFSDYQTTVYIYDDGRIRKELCKEIGWPNVTTTGEMMYKNTSFDTYKKAFRYACESVGYDKYLRMNYRENLKDDFKRIFRRIKYRWEDRFDWLYINTILRVKSWFIKD